MFVPPQLPLAQLLNHAGQLQRAGNLVAAAGVYRQILRQQPRNAEVLGRLSQVLIGLNQLDDAKRTLEKAMKLSPKAPVLHHDMHLLHRRAGELAKAHDSIDKALRLSPRQPIFTASKAELFISQGEYDRAMKTIEPVLSTAPALTPVAMVLASLAPRFGREAEAIAGLRANMENAEVGPVLRMRAAFSLAHLLDWTGDLDGAVAAATVGNSLVSREWDAAAHREKVDRCIATWTRESVSALPHAASEAGDLLLVVGMPRCGNLLVARMLTSLDGVVSVGERNDILATARELEGGAARGAPILLNTLGCTTQVLTDRAATYMTPLRTAHPSASLLIDRNPLNFLGLGLASRMLPGVRVIHCRRDPADSAVSCWMAPFTAVVPFMYDQANVGAFQRDADRLMDHWKAVLDTPILDVNYEDLLRKPEPTARAIVEFVKRPWSDRVLEPARQWVTTVTRTDGSLRDVFPDGRPGLGADHESRLPELFAALRGA